MVTNNLTKLRPIAPERSHKNEIITIIKLAPKTVNGSRNAKDINR